jgi:hypothetical protein
MIGIFMRIILCELSCYFFEGEEGLANKAIAELYTGGSPKRRKARRHDIFLLWRSTDLLPQGGPNSPWI